MNKAEKAAYSLEWYHAHPDKVKAWKQRYKEPRREEIAAKSREYHVKNREKILAQQKLYRLKNRDKLLAKKKADWIKNKEHYSIKSKEYRKVNAEAIKEYDHFKYLNNMKHIEGFFYIAKFERYIKIGTAINWERRKCGYDNHNPLELKLLKCEWYEGANVQEKMARWHLRKYRLKGKDWFVDVPDEDIQLVIDGLD